jgi:hypothetical protein
MTGLEPINFQLFFDWLNHPLSLTINLIIIIIMGIGYVVFWIYIIYLIVLSYLNRVYDNVLRSLTIQ